MNWKNCNINVLQRVNTPKFSKLDNIVAPLRPFELFFDDVLIDMIVGYTKLYNHREKADISFEITKEKIYLLLRILLLSGYHILPDPKMYLGKTADTFV